MEQDKEEVAGGPAEEGLAGLLLERGLVNQHDLDYARRVQSKLGSKRALLDVLCELWILVPGEFERMMRGTPVELPLERLLVDLGTLDPDELEQALAIQRDDPRAKADLGAILVEQNFLSEADLLHARSLQLGVQDVDPLAETLDPQLLEEAPLGWCRQHGLLPIRSGGGRTLVAFVDPSNSESLAAAAQVYGEGQFDAALASRGAIEKVWSRVDATRGGSGIEVAEDVVVADVDRMLREALARDASDIHVEPQHDRLRIRFREDGVLVPYRDLPVAAAAPLTSRLKVLCKADIAERRHHQGGRFTQSVDGLEIDMRVSFYVTVHGQKTVLRLLNRARTLQPLESIGMPPRTLERYKLDVLGRPSGVVLVTGPTGSGKTSTLYSSIHHVNHEGLAIVTAEDPVEYTIPGISQCSLNADIDLTYEETLRHIVRQDPDVIVIGEIRDRFSAETAIQAALTGHKVLTTFHTEDTIGGLVRLLNMNIEAFLISSTVVSVLAQRLVRRICDHCAVTDSPTAADLRQLGLGPNALEGARLRMGRGCAQCHGTGYRGRVAIFELLILVDQIRDAILAHSTSYEIRAISRRDSGLISLFEDGLVKAARGLTTLSELHRMLPRLDSPRPLPELRRLVGED